MVISNQTKSNSCVSFHVPDELFADLGMDYYGEDVQKAAEDCDITNELIVHPGPPTQSRSRRVFFAVIGEQNCGSTTFLIVFPFWVYSSPNTVTVKTWLCNKKLWLLEDRSSNLS